LRRFFVSFRSDSDDLRLVAKEKADGASGEEKQMTELELTFSINEVSPCALWNPMQQRQRFEVLEKFKLH